MSKRRGLYGLYGISDAVLLPDTEVLLAAASAAIKGGLKILQYRDKHASYQHQCEQARLLRQLCLVNEVTFIINDNLDLALEVGADGVHVGQNDSLISSARETLGAEAIIGCSCYNDIERARQAQHQGADYVAFGRFYPSLTKPDALPAYPELLQQARAELEIPLCAIGGITPKNAANLIEQGADMVAVIQGLFAAKDIRQQAQGFSRLFDLNTHRLNDGSNRS